MDRHHDRLGLGRVRRRVQLPVFQRSSLESAVTLAMAQAGKFAWTDVGGYVLAQLAGGVVGGTLVFLFYREHFKTTDDRNAKLACFCTAPNIRNVWQAFFCETVGTFLLVLPVFLMTDAKIKLPAAAGGIANEVNIGLVLWAPYRSACWSSPSASRSAARRVTRSIRARPGPRLAHAFLPIPGKRDSDWVMHGYRWWGRSSADSWRQSSIRC